ncbi:MAG: hypothetical protein MR018_07035, partial [Clostridiales bacterium]|nr:hypothetical protein [Clostridiales bacterium]
MKTLMISVCAALVACACAAEDAPKPAAAPVAPAAPAAAPAAAKPVDPAAANRARARRARADLRRPRSGASARVKVSPFGKLKDGTEVKLFRLHGAGGLILDVSDYGGRLVRCYAPDKFGNLADV